jgi:hypothetical protein
MKLKGLLAAIMFLAAASLIAVETTVWQVGTFEDFLKGQLDGVSVTENGELGLAPESNVVFSPEEALVLSLAADREHRIFVGTGHQGKVFRVNPDGKASLLFTAQEPDIFALAVGPGGDLYVGSSPEGKIYRVTPQGKSSVFYDPQAKYIWALLFGPHGNLYVGTGDQGEILKVNAKGEGSVFYHSNQTHIMCLAFDSKDNLLAGSVPDGLIYRISPEGKAFVIYQADLPEIHSIVTDGEGRIFAAALGAGQGRGVPAIVQPTAPVIHAPAEVMTVTVEGSTGTIQEEKTKGKSQKQPQTQKKQPQKKTPSFIRPLKPGATLPSYVGQKSRGEVLELLPDSSAETLWSSNEASAYGLVVRSGKVIFSTDSNGEIYELNPADNGRDLRLIAETHESVVSRLLLENQSLYMATSNVGKLFHLEFKLRHTGTYESAVEDTKFISRWGHITWRGDFPSGSSVDFYTRTGNSQRPDATWSDWAGPLSNPDGSRITSPPARYIQWKAVFHGSSTAGPLLDEVSVSYLNQNLPPQIRSLNISTSNERTSAAGESNAPPSPSAAVSLAVSNAINLASSAGASLAQSPTPLTISWRADDPNGDTLVYSIYVKAADEHAWHLLKKDLKETNYTVEPHTLPDGKYEAKVVASDEPSNPPALARTAEMVSAPFWVDNTPPSVEVTSQRSEGEEAVVAFRAEDSTSPIMSAEYSVDGGEWKDILSDGGIVDSPTESFTVRLSGLKSGEHLVILRAFDSGGNAGLGKAVVEVAKSGEQKN